MKGSRWPLRRWLVVLLTTISTLSYLLVALVVVLVRTPQITEETRTTLSLEAADLAQRSEGALGRLQAELGLVSALLYSADASVVQLAMEQAVQQGGFNAVYRVGQNGRVTQVALDPSLPTGLADEIKGNDLSRDPFYAGVRDGGLPGWSDKYLSPVTSKVAVSVAVPAGQSVLIGEVPLSYLLDALYLVTSRSDYVVSVLDRRGEVLADTEHADHMGVLNLAGDPLFLSAAPDATANGPFELEGQRYDAAVTRSRLLNWYFMTRSPAGLDNPRIGATLHVALLALAGTVLIGVLLAPIWAHRMSLPIHAIARRTREVTQGNEHGRWPKPWTQELAQLVGHIEEMATTLRDRERELATIFETSPVGIAVLDPAHNHRCLRANTGFARLMGVSPEQVVGTNGEGMKVWVDPRERVAFYQSLAEQGWAETEAWLYRQDGSRFLAALSARTYTNVGEVRAVLLARDITRLRANEAEIRSLNTDLESRVQQRTEELSNTLARLQQAQEDLVQAEKLASLGALVAGVAHELNTPLGNGVMAVSTMQSALKNFHEASVGGLRRSALDELLKAMDTGTDIATRNLHRAADLVTSFKQVAADQTSEQRRKFELSEVGHEILVTLSPLLKRHGVLLRTHLQDGVKLDSYPGPLGQVLTNLVTNALIHAFDNQPGPELDVEGYAVAGDMVVVQVRDNGCGIAPDLLPRVFDPFVTTRMGQGGTGLGLYIVYNIVTKTLGGTIKVDSTPGQGALFTLRMPLVAPQATDTPVA
jgi:PAS domain S-box-containing protein